MKNKLLALTLLALLAGGASCKKILEAEPSDFSVPGNYFQTETQVNSYLASVYDVLNDGNWYNNQFRANISEGTDESYNTASIGSPYPAHYSASSSDASITGFWQAIYRGLDRANTLLENLDRASLSADKKARVLGEAKFLRAYYLFTATQWFGDVPLKTTSTKTQGDAQIAFTPSKEVYDFVIREMTEAEGLLAAQKASTLAYNERVTYTTVQGMLARVCLFAAGNPVNDTKRYAEALDWAKKVKASGEHSLHPDYRQVFINHSADAYDNVNRESMWEVGFKTDAANTALREQMSNNVGVSVGINKWGRITSTTRTTAVLYRTYGSTYDAARKQDLTPDLRRDWNVAPYTLGGVPSTSSQETVPTIEPVAWNSWWMRFSGKWRRQYEVVVPRDNNNLPQNFPLLRYADVLLMLAEAENEVNGPTDIAYAAVNEVRRRAWGKGNRVTGVTVTNGGSGYTAAPRVTIAPSLTGPGEGYDAALATATVSGGKVTAINVTSSVGFYNSVPAVILTGLGTGATATAELTPVDPATADVPLGLSREAFRKFLQDERLRELAGEALRRADLKRWNVLEATVKSRSDLAVNGSAQRFSDNTQVIPPVSNAGDRTTASHDGANVSARSMFLPIPLSEILNNRLAKQNNGY
ncbi:RagB/SusD family nutrient uptake outer membrane protein [Paraflavisolibacter sp. H34]|uniref:RagB/SusD family nutrient uptake outer membrane protein n=1 Tax=Huijunlia imazamoxiresistens TaxID=3127457 RepID=UPI0030190345